jgi:ubiquinone/menaquinone biosynthesis C-methylase UbiE
MNRIHSRLWNVIFLSGICQIALAVNVETVEEQKRSPVPEGINAGFLAEDLDVQEWLERFERETREVFACRQAIIEAIGLAEGDRLADVGAGTGLFVPLMAKKVGLKGQIFALDISPRLVQYLHSRVAEEKLENVTVIRSKEESTELAENSVDVVFVCDTYHHFEYHVPMLDSIRRALRRGGQLILIDFDRIPGQSREWLLTHVRDDKDGFKNEIIQAGFTFKEEVKIEGFRENYFLRFQKP